jgi:hypothetical protein
VRKSIAVEDEEVNRALDEVVVFRRRKEIEVFIRVVIAQRGIKTSNGRTLSVDPVVALNVFMVVPAHGPVVLPGQVAVVPNRKNKIRAPTLDQRGDKIFRVDTRMRLVGRGW